MYWIVTINLTTITYLIVVIFIKMIKIHLIIYFNLQQKLILNSNWFKNFQNFLFHFDSNNFKISVKNLMAIVESFNYQFN